MRTYRGRALISGILIGFGLGWLLLGLASVGPGALSPDSLRRFWTFAIVGIVLIVIGIVMEIYYRAKLKALKKTTKKIDVFK